MMQVVCRLCTAATAVKEHLRGAICVCRCGDVVVVVMGGRGEVLGSTLSRPITASNNLNKILIYAIMIL
jgi:ribosomal protein S27E